VSRYDYETAQRLWAADTPFHGLVMGAMLRADPMNRALLSAVFPDVWAELQARENALGGRLPGDDEPIRLTVTTVEPGEKLWPKCTQCRQEWTAPACGPAHAIIAADPRLHR
jgi:hypothetical protein